MAFARVASVLEPEVLRSPPTGIRLPRLPALNRRFLERLPKTLALGGMWLELESCQTFASFSICRAQLSGIGHSAGPKRRETRPDKGD